MASANWLKATTQKAGAMKKHLGQVERENGNHSNEHINKELSHQNYAIGCSDYLEALERMKARTKEVDAVQPPKRIRKDRVTCCFIELPCPDELTQQGLSDKFFHKAYQVMKNFFGDSNVHGGFVHKDERHEYTDKDGKQRMSLEHMHTLVSAYTENKGINGKAFETRGRLRAFNKALDDMCIREFGISLNTGETPERKSVETLKKEAEARQELGELNKRVGELQRAEAESRDKFLEADERATEAEIRASTAEKRAEVAERKIVTAEKRLRQANAECDVATKELAEVLNKKAKAAVIHKPIFGGDKVTYHKNTLDDVQAIGYKASEHMREARKTLQKAESIMQHLQAQEEAIKPLYAQAEQERKKQQELRENMEKKIEERAKELADKQVKEMFHGVPTKREKRLEDFCEEIKFKDGTSVLDAFTEQERRLKQKHKGYER